ncbi:helix-turn-helix domain-containing protein [Halobacillus yeomjeoni]|uniref:helix-turn-helix domain-containing protein n=1 Tax=Halobacillus yeomjeoni TaxID=311194 RepID=UPI001CD1F91E|nr:helix-turn-helix domain-containing protein [Halobacillus yeomjeoni]MCA0984292.1 helix-turn-helix domain-containing protein [Halobacillus yeomjeoni]
MQLKHLSMDELYDKEEETFQRIEEGDNSGYYPLITVYEEMLRRFRRERDTESMAYVKEKLVDYLVRYGSYMKMKKEKNNNDAFSSLEKALELNSRLPIAHYRLGFLQYRKHEYLNASRCFHQAITLQERSQKSYMLDERQLYYAHLYAINSELHLVYETHEKMGRLNMKDRYDPLDSGDMSGLYERLLDSDAYLANHAFVKRTNEEVSYCSKEACEALIDNPDSNTFYLYFGDRMVEALFADHSVDLSHSDADILRYLVLKSSDKPLDRIELSRLQNKINPVANNTLSQVIRRLRARVDPLGFSNHIVHTDQGYSIDPLPGYIIMYRHDDGVALDYLAE